jgi:hypothetical protein
LCTEFCTLCVLRRIAPPPIERSVCAAKPTRSHSPELHRILAPGCTRPRLMGIVRDSLMPVSHVPSASSISAYEYRIREAKARTNPCSKNPKAEVRCAQALGSWRVVAGYRVRGLLGLWALRPRQAWHTEGRFGVENHGVRCCCTPRLSNPTGSVPSLRHDAVRIYADC